MKSYTLGKSISIVEVLNISKNGIWLYVKGNEYHLPYKDYPWFKDAAISKIYKVKLLSHSQHLYWPELDIDLELDSLKNPNHYPLVFK